MGGLSCMDSCVKTLMFIFNFIIWLAGAAILIIGIVVAVNNPFKNYFTVTINFNQAYWIVVLVIIFATAAILVAIGFLGCCGACKENSCMLKMYAAILFILIALEIVGIVLIAVFHNQIQQDLESNMLNQTTASYFNETSNDALSIAWNEMMVDLQCCGVMSYVDWSTSQYHAKYTNNPVPATCCRWNGDAITGSPVNLSNCYVEAKGYTAPANGTFVDLHPTGCYTTIENTLINNKTIVIAILAAVAGAMLLGIFAACCLAKTFSGSNAYA